MKPTTRQTGRQIRSLLGDAFDQIRMARAAELARSGRFLEAAALLAPEGKLPATARKLDLLARIAICLRDFRTARTCWKGALQIEPENPAYPECLRELALAEKRARLKSRVIFFAAISLLGATLAWLGVMIWQLAGRSAFSRSPDHSTAAPATQPAAQKKNLPANSQGKRNESAPLH